MIPGSGGYLRFSKQRWTTFQEEWFESCIIAPWTLVPKIATKKVSLKRWTSRILPLLRFVDYFSLSFWALLHIFIYSHIYIYPYIYISIYIYPYISIHIYIYIHIYPSFMGVAQGFYELSYKVSGLIAKLTCRTWRRFGFLGDVKN